MKVIELDARSWATVPDFYAALLPAIGAPDWHSDLPIALADSMIGGGVNSIKPPYAVRILNTDSLPETVEAEVLKVVEAIYNWKAARKARTGDDIEVSVQLVGGPSN
jgi:hypothetical protein